MKSIHTDQYKHLLVQLIGARKRAGITQEILAERLGRPQSFVSKIERGERRIDVVEFLQVCKLIDLDPHAVITDLEQTIAPSG